MAQIIYVKKWQYYFQDKQIHKYKSSTNLFFKIQNFALPFMGYGR